MHIEDRAHTQRQRNTRLKKEKDYFGNFISRENVYIGNLSAFYMALTRRKWKQKNKSLDVDDLIPRVYGRVGKPKQNFKKNALKYFSVVMLKQHFFTSLTFTKLYRLTS